MVATQDMLSSAALTGLGRPTGYEFISDLDHAQRALTEIGRHKVVVFDTETTGLDWFTEDLLLLQFATPEQTYIIDARKVNCALYKPLMEDPAVLKIAHNVNFDYKFLKIACGIRSTNVACTMLMDQMLHAGISKTGGADDDDEEGTVKRMSFGLAAVAKRRLGLEIEKGTRNTFIGMRRGEFTREQLDYAAKDVDIPIPILAKQLTDIARLKMMLIARIENQVAPAVAEMELRGWVIDTETWRKNVAESEALRDQRAAELLEAMGYETRQTVVPLFADAGDTAPGLDLKPLNSNQILVDYYRRLGNRIKAYKDTKLPQWVRETLELAASVPSVNEKNVIAPLQQKAGKIMQLCEAGELALPSDDLNGLREILGFSTKLLEYKEHFKIVGTYGETFLAKIHPKTGRLHARFDQMGTDTGRFASRNPNAQNLPRKKWVRHCFQGAPGNKIVVADYGQIELRILCQLAEDKAMIDAFNSGYDLHSYTAAKMYGVDYDELDKNKKKPPYEDWRFGAKAINFGLAYGRGASSLADQLNCDLDEAKEKIKLYFAAYPGVQKWLEKAGKRAASLGYAETALGRRRFFELPPPSLKHSNREEYQRLVSGIERAGKNSPIQGCCCGHTLVVERSQGCVPIASLSEQVVTIWDGEGWARGVVAPSGKKQKVRITLQGGNVIECSPDHKFLVRDTVAREKWVTPARIGPCDRIVLGDAVPAWSLDLDPEGTLVPRAGRTHNYRPTSVLDLPDRATLGEWLGRVASDGSVSDAVVNAFVAEHEEVFLPRLQAATAAFGPVSLTSKEPDADRNEVRHVLTVCSRSLAEQLHNIGIKRGVPTIAWRDATLLAGYLRGMFDGDGGVNADGATLVLGDFPEAQPWAREIQQALLLFGIRGRVRTYPGDRTVVQVQKADMPLFAQRIGFLNPGKQAKAEAVVPAEKYRSPRYGRACAVKSVEVTDEWVEMYDVIESETHRFMANGLVTHNSNADIVKLALIELNRILPAYGACQVSSVHDELCVESPPEHAETVKCLMESAMVQAGKIVCPDVVILAEPAIGDYWDK